MPQIVPPTERECERCGRRERWDETAGVWRVIDSDDEVATGQAHCLHEWDINGTYSPIEES